MLDTFLSLAVGAVGKLFEGMSITFAQDFLECLKDAFGIILENGLSDFFGEIVFWASARISGSARLETITNFIPFLKSHVSHSVCSETKRRRAR